MRGEREIKIVMAAVVVAVAVVVVVVLVVAVVPVAQMIAVAQNFLWAGCVDTSSDNTAFCEVPGYSLRYEYAL